MERIMLTLSRPSIFSHVTSNHQSTQRYIISDKFDAIIHWEHENKTAAQILNINSNDISLASLKKAYRTQALSYHPDKNPGTSEEKAAQAFKIITQAYEYLIFTIDRSQFSAQVGGNISNNPFYYASNKTKNPGRFVYTYTQMKCSVFDFLSNSNLISESIDLEYLEDLFRNYHRKFFYDLKTQCENPDFAKDHLDLLSESFNSNLSPPLKQLYIELACLKKETRLLQQFSNQHPDHLKTILLDYLNLVFFNDNDSIAIVAPYLKPLSEEVLIMLVTKNPVFLRYIKYFDTSLDGINSLRFTRKMIYQKPHLYQYLDNEQASRLDLIVFAFQNPEHLGIMANIRKLSSLKWQKASLPPEIFNALLSKFPNLKEYGNDDGHFNGPLEPLYTYLKYSAVAFPVILVLSVALLITHPTLLTIIPVVALLSLACSMSGTFAVLFMTDYLRKIYTERLITNILSDAKMEYAPEAEAHNSEGSRMHM